MSQANDWMLINFKEGHTVTSPCCTNLIHPASKIKFNNKIRVLVFERRGLIILIPVRVSVFERQDLILEVSN